MLRIVDNVSTYKKEVSADIEHRIWILQSLFITLNVLIILAGFATATLTTLLLSKLIYQTYPEWFFFASAGISAFTTFFSTVMNFFLIKDQIAELKRKRILIEAEFIKYKDKLSGRYQGENADYYFLTSILAVLGNKSARKEVGLE